MADEFKFSPKVDKLIDDMNLELDDKIKELSIISDRSEGKMFNK